MRAFLPIASRCALRAAAVALLTCVAALPLHAQRPTGSVHRLKAVVVVFDGLRPDHVTPALTPALHAMGQRGVVSRQHHALFPTVTRVNASALATGAGPGGHGILDNTIYLPAVRATRGLNTGNAREMMLADSVLGGTLLTAPSLQERLAPRGLRVMVASAGSSGSAYLLAGAGRAVTLNTEYSSPASLQPMVERLLGSPPPDASPHLAANARAVDALLRIGVDSLDSDVAYLWLTDPDHTAHGAGLGSTLADSSIRAADREFGRLLAGLRARRLEGQVNVFVVSDHGFSTHAGREAVLPSVLRRFADRVVVAGSSVYVRDGRESTRTEVVRALQQSPAFGAIFTAPMRTDTPDVAVEPGTLSLASIGWSHARSGDVLFSANWSHARNDRGIMGRTEEGGAAGHGTTSPYDITATFVAAGPQIRHGMTATLPSSNADIVPTILHVLGLPDRPGMSGRSLNELLVRDAAGDAPAVIRDSLVAERRDDATGIRYRTVAFRTRVGTTWYFDSTLTTRTPTP